MIGKVWLVGAGPGDPGLITVRGREVLEAAEVVLYDALSHHSLLEFCPRAEQRDVGKRYARPSPSQDSIIQQLLELARSGRRVVRLKGGDPLLFARGAEEALALARAGIPFEIVPGIASPVAASAYAGISLTHRGLSSSVTFITGSDRDASAWSPEAWHRLATATDTLCVLMGMRRIEEITEALQAGGRSSHTPAAVVQWGARAEQRVVCATLGTIANEVRRAGLSNPAIIFVGEVVGLRDQIRWFDNRPLFGKRLLILRAAEQAHSTARAIRTRGAEPVVFPVIEIHPPPNPELLRSRARAVGTYDWVLFTSANGVERFFDALRELGRDARAFGAARIGVIGPRTGQALGRFGVLADLVAEDYVGESLAHGLLQRFREDATRHAPRVLLPRALEARSALPDALRAAGAEVDVVPAYETRPIPGARRTELVRALSEGEIHAVLFTSASTVESLTDLLGNATAELLERATVASIGPITSRKASEAGLKVHVQAEQYTIEGLLAALERYYAERC